jgi:hypothetical protein
MDAKLYADETECRVLERLTGHARVRMDARRLSRDTVAAAIRFGKVARVRGATIYAIGRREVSRYAEQMIDLSPYEGVQVVCSPDGGILTAYRNRNFRGLRPNRRHSHRANYRN